LFLLKYALEKMNGVSDEAPPYVLMLEILKLPMGRQGFIKKLKEIRCFNIAWQTAPWYIITFVMLA